MDSDHLRCKNLSRHEDDEHANVQDVKYYEMLDREALNMDSYPGGPSDTSVLSLCTSCGQTRMGERCIFVFVYYFCDMFYYCMCCVLVDNLN